MLIPVPEMTGCAKTRLAPVKLSCTAEPAATTDGETLDSVGGRIVNVTGMTMDPLTASGEEIVTAPL